MNIKKIFLFSILFLLLSQVGQAKKLSAQKVLELTYHKSLSAKSIKLQSDSSLYDILATKAQYDLYMEADFLHTQDKSERSSPVFGTDTKSTDFSFQLAQHTPLGTDISFAFQNTRNSSDSAFVASSVLYDSRYLIQIQQPLLQNIFGYNTRKNIKYAKEYQKSVKQDTNNQLQELALNNLMTYWNLYLYSNLSKINQDAVHLARKLYKTNQEKLKLGLIEKADLYAFAANLDLKKADLLTVKSSQVKSENNLKTAINFNDDIQISYEPVHSEKLPTLNTLKKSILDEHPKLKSMRKMLSAINTQKKIYKNSLLPQFNALAALTLNGIDPTYSQAHSDIYNGNPIWSAGVNISFPLQNRSSRANYKKTLIQQQQQVYNIKNTEVTFSNQVEEYYKNYKTLLNKVYTTAQAVKHQKLKWEGEVKKYQQGRSDPDLVIRYQNDYLDTRKLHLQAKVEFQINKLYLDYLRGKLVVFNNLKEEKL